MGQSLAGKRVVISAGHGFYHHSTLGWTTQRGLIDGLIEDIHTNEIVMDHLMEYLEGAGAQVITCRARSRTTDEIVIQNDDGAPSYQESGTWYTSLAAGWQGSTYRWTPTSPTATSYASFEATPITSDEYPVYVNFRAGANRSPSVQVEVHHAGGIVLREVDQTRDGTRWVYVGTFPFRAGELAIVRILGQSASSGVVIADAVKIGDGMGDIIRGGSVSGEAKWRECSRYHAESFGAPPTVWNPVATGNDNADDVTCRPFYAEWWGADLYLSLHTNAATGSASGTSTYIYNGGATTGSAAFQTLLHNQLVLDIQTDWDPNWIDRGMQSANFGELRELSTMPGALIELAFHDNVGGDTEALHHPHFRRIAGRAMYRAIASQLGAQWTLPPPVAVAMINDAQGGLELKWSPVPGATAYAVSLSRDGFAFDDPLNVSATNHTLSGLFPGEARYARVASINAGGSGPKSEVFGGRLSPRASAPLLLVQGFDRWDRNIKSWENRQDTLVRGGPAVEAHPRAAHPFDGCNNEAIINGLVSLSSYLPRGAVGYFLGEESTQEETFSMAEQSLVSSFIAQGGRLFVSGAELAWDLDYLGSASDQVFCNNTLGISYVNDDAGVYTTLPSTTGPLSPMPSLLFDNGNAGIYNVDYPDAIAPFTSNGQTVLHYANGLSAGVLSPSGRVLSLGFPIDAIVSPALRTTLLTRILELLSPLRVQPPAALSIGQITPIPLSFPASPNALCLTLPAIATIPATPTGYGSYLPIAMDALTTLALSASQSTFIGTVTLLDAVGGGQLLVNIPPVPSLSGFSFFLTGVTLNVGGVPHEIAPAVMATIL